MKALAASGSIAAQTGWVGYKYTPNPFANAWHGASRKHGGIREGEMCAGGGSAESGRRQFTSLMLLLSMSTVAVGPICKGSAREIEFAHSNVTKADVITSTTASQIALTSSFDLIQKQCGFMISAVRSAGGQMLYRGGPPEGLRQPRVFNEAPDLLDPQTYGTEGAAFFQRLEHYLEVLRLESARPPAVTPDISEFAFKVPGEENLFKADFPIPDIPLLRKFPFLEPEDDAEDVAGWRRTKEANVKPSNAHIAVADVSQAAFWGQACSCWPIGEFEYLHLADSRLIYPPTYMQNGEKEAYKHVPQEKEMDVFR